jgi:hypothetical protein
MAVAVTSCSSAPGPAQPTASATGSASDAAAAGSSPASSSASSSPSPVPAGDTRVGGSAQGISVDVPAEWVTVNLAKETVQSAANRIGLSGISAATLMQDMDSLQKLHGILVIDVKYAVEHPQAFDPNLNAYCSTSGVTDTGSAAVPLIKTGAAAEFAQVGATHITQQDLEIGGVAGVETSYQLSSSGVGTIYGSQLEVLPKPNQACYVTVSVTKGESIGDVLSTAAATAQFP